MAGDDGGVLLPFFRPNMNSFSRSLSPLRWRNERRRE
jgi:hypothetical protein